MIDVTGKKLFEIKKLFFDRASVTKAVDKAARKALNHIGGMIRLTARRSIRTAKSHNAASNPGNPPLSHTGDLNKKILYGYDQSSQSVVIGPVLLNKGTGAPHNLEFGGYAKLNSRKFGGRRNVYIKPRPYMYPALEKNQPRICRILKDSVRS